MAKRIQFKTDIIDWADPVDYQGNMGQCGTNGVDNAIGIVSNLYGDNFSVNRQILYNMYNIDNNHHGKDYGVAPIPFAQVLSTRGVTESTSIPYGKDYLSVVPSAGDYADAAQHKVVLEKITHSGYQQERLSNILASKLMEGKPLLIYYTVMSDFASQTGPLSGQSGANYASKMGGHLVTAVGYETSTHSMIVQSWGEQYGDHGYFKLSMNSFNSLTGGDGRNLWDVYQISEFDGKDFRMNSYTEYVSISYVAVLGRAPELEGMKWFKGQSVEDIANQLVTSQEFMSHYGTLTNEQFVDVIYDNIMDRDPDAGGLAYWSNQLAQGVSRGKVVSEITHIISQEGYWQDGLWFGDGSLGRAPNTTDPNIFEQSRLFNNRINAGEIYAITMQAASGFNDVAREIIDEVTSDEGSIWGVALIGVGEQLGYNHIVPPNVIF